MMSCTWKFPTRATVAVACCGCGAVAVALSTRRRGHGRAQGQCRRLRLNDSSITAICGAAGEAAALAATYPLETLKVRCQTTGRGVQHVMASLAAEGGVGKISSLLYHGFGPAAVTVMVTGALYLSIFGWMQGAVQAGLDRLAHPTTAATAGRKKPLSGEGMQDVGSQWRDSSVLSAGIAAGATSAIIALLELPTEVVRLRMQSGTSSHLGFRQQMRQAWADVTSIGCWTYLAPCLVKEVPQDATEFATYGKLTRMWNERMPAKVDNVAGADWLVGAGAGVAATIVSMPADVIKTRVACVPPATLRSGLVGSLHTYACAASMVYKECGLRGFYSGTGPRLIKVPSTMIYWVTVEQTRRLLSQPCDCTECRASRR